MNDGDWEMLGFVVFFVALLGIVVLMAIMR